MEKESTPPKILFKQSAQIEWSHQNPEGIKNDSSITKKINRIVNLLKTIPQDTVYELSNYPNQGDSTPVTICKFINTLENNNLFISFKIKKDEGKTIVDKKITISRFRFCETAGFIVRDPDNRKTFTVMEDKINYYLYPTTPKLDQ